jgi:hypothetical protein
MPVGSTPCLGSALCNAAVVARPYSSMVGAGTALGPALIAAISLSMTKYRTFDPRYFSPSESR